MFQTLAPRLDAPPAHPVAFCGMPASQLLGLERDSHETSAAPNGAPRGDEPVVAATMPLRDRVWHLFCSGASYSAIAQQLHLDRQTVTRHVRAVQEMLAAGERESLALVRMRAIEAQFQILAATWEAYQTECQREDDYYSALASPAHHTSPLPHPVATKKPYRAHRARLLSLASTVARTAARLEGLFDHPAIHSADADAHAPSPCADPTPSSSQDPAPPPNEDAVASCGMPDRPLPLDPSACPPASPASSAVLPASLPLSSAASAVSPTVCPPLPLASSPVVAHPSPARQLRFTSVTLAPAPFAATSARSLSRRSRRSRARPGLPSRAAPPRTTRQRSSAFITTRSSA